MKWKDAPDGPGLWVSRGPEPHGEQCWLFTGTTWARCYPKGRRWYGPIKLPPDTPNPPITASGLALRELGELRAYLLSGRVEEFAAEIDGCVRRAIRALTSEARPDAEPPR